MISPWHIPDPQPTTLMSLWADAEPPTKTEVLAMVGRAAGGARELGEMDDSPPDVRWNVAARLGDRDITHLFWLEPAKPLGPDLEGMQCNAKWALGVQTILDADDPIATYARLLRLVMNAFPEALGFFDVNSHKVLLPRDLAWMLPAANVEPAADALWTIHAVTRNSDARSPVWLHTHGLDRCGRAELEILEVPHEHVAAAAELINIAAAWSLDQPLPEPGEPTALGHNLSVAFQPWQTCVPFVSIDDPGALNDRENDSDGTHTGVRAVLCAPKPKGVFRRVWAWPEEAVTALAGGRVMVDRSDRATARAQALARATWPELAMAFADAARTVPTNERGDVRFLVKVGFPYGTGAEAGHEHMWLEITRFEGDRAEARLVNQPFHATTLREGDVTWIERSHVSDWSVLTPHGRFEPGRGCGLRGAFD